METLYREMRNDQALLFHDKFFQDFLEMNMADLRRSSRKNSVNIDFDKIITQLIEDKNTEISRLSDQIAMKDHQIAEKDKQIDQQQQLTLTAMKDKEELKLELDEAKVEIDEAKAQVEKIQIKQEETAKKSFFGRLFGK